MNCYVGIDVSEDWLDVWVHPLEVYRRVTNDVQGVAKLTLLLQAIDGPIGRIVLEATGNLEYRAARHLQQAGFEVAVVNPNRTAAFRTMRGTVAKTDALDAEMLARFAETFEPLVRPVPTEAEHELQALTARRRQLIDMLTAEQNRLRRVDSDAVKQMLEDSIASLHTQKAIVDEALLHCIESDEQLAQHYALLTSIPAIGPAVATTLITDLPELGTLNKKQIAALAGLAPHNNESGKTIKRGTTRRSGGRKNVKSALYMAAIVATRHNVAMKAFYLHLVEKGKPKKVALVAVMRKLIIIANQLIKQNRKWNENYQTT